MTDERDQKLEQRIHEELRRLPERKAPASLIPRVLSEIRERANLPWWQRPWIDWPRHIQLLALVVLPALLGWLTYLAFAFWPQVSPGNWLTALGARLEFLSPVTEVLASLGNALLIATRAMFQQYWLVALAMVGALYLTCVGLGTAFYRMVLIKA